MGDEGGGYSKNVIDGGEEQTFYGNQGQGQGQGQGQQDQTLSFTRRIRNSLSLIKLFLVI